jgi:hypothetical protein
MKKINYTFAFFLIVQLAFTIEKCEAQWEQVSNGMGNIIGMSLASSGNNIFCGSNYGVYLSTNNGTNWTQTTLNNRNVYSLAVNGNNIFAGTYQYGVYLSTDNGINWSQTSLSNQVVNALVANGNNIFAGTNPNGVYISNDNGNSWTQKNEGMGNLYIRSFCILNNYLFAGSQTAGVYRRPLGEITANQIITNEVPLQFSLSQNYPNPFNPVTKIKFDIPMDSRLRGNDKVVLKVYDVLGKEVATLVNEQLKPGTYEVEFDGTNYQSGVYFYQLVVSSEQLVIYKETKKVILMK